MDIIHDIAVFTVPGLVAFPGMVLPMHIFEPRYRKMAEDSEKKGFDIGLALPQRTIHTVDPKGDPLQSNAASYEPHQVLSAGALKILKKMDDGRFLVRIEIRYRCAIVETLQSLPYTLARVKELEDQLVDPGEARDLTLQILEIASEILDKSMHVDKANLHPSQVGLTLQTIFNWTLGWLPSDHELAQKMLEMDSLAERARVLLARMGAPRPKKLTKPVTERRGKVIYVDFPHGASPRSEG